MKEKIMKKAVLMLMLAIVILTAGFSAGCGNSNENANPDNTATEQNVITSNEEIDAYIASVIEQSNAINTAFEQEELTQTEMNLKSMELSELWDNALNYIIDELKNRLTEDEFANLQNEQLAWTAEKDKAVEEAGKEFEGGSFHSFVVNSEAARITEERVLELYDDMLK